MRYHTVVRRKGERVYSTNAGTPLEADLNELLERYDADEAMTYEGEGFDLEEGDKLVIACSREIAEKPLHAYKITYTSNYGAEDQVFKDCTPDRAMKLASMSIGRKGGTRWKTLKTTGATVYKDGVVIAQLGNDKPGVRSWNYICVAAIVIVAIIWGFAQ